MTLSRAAEDLVEGEARWCNRESNGSNVIPRWARPGVAGLGCHSGGSSAAEDLVEGEARLHERAGGVEAHLPRDARVACYRGTSPIRNHRVDG